MTDAAFILLLAACVLMLTVALGRLSAVHRKLNSVLNILQVQRDQGEKMAKTLDDILQGVQDESTVDDSIVTLVTNLKAAVDAAGGNQAKIDAAFAQITANKQKVADAVTANTPAA
jgi:hypothetical protein